MYTPQKNYNRRIERPKINEYIRVSPVRVIDENSQQLGVFPLEEAIQMARQKELDLVLITDKVNPAICKIIDYGKYTYQQEKKKKGQSKQKGGEIKGIRIGLITAKHDLEMKAKKAGKFIQDGNKIKIEMVLRGREKAHQDIAKQKIRDFIALVPAETIIEQESKQPKGLTVILSKKIK